VRPYADFTGVGNARQATHAIFLIVFCQRREWQGGPRRVGTRRSRSATARTE